MLMVNHPVYYMLVHLKYCIPRERRRRLTIWVILIGRWARTLFVGAVKDLRHIPRPVMHRTNENRVTATTVVIRFDNDNNVTVNYIKLYSIMLRYVTKHVENSRFVKIIILNSNIDWRYIISRVQYILFYHESCGQCVLSYYKSCNIGHTTYFVPFAKTNFRFELLFNYYHCSSVSIMQARV